MGFIVFLNLRVVQLLSKWLRLNKQLIPFWKMFSLVQKFIISKYHSDFKFNNNITNCLRHAGLYLRYCRCDKCVPNRLRFEYKNIILNFPGLHKKFKSDSNLYQSLYSSSISLDLSKTLKWNNVMSFNKLHNTTNQAGAKIYF